MCMGGENEAGKKKGEFVCRKCGAVASKKKMLCRPKKIKD